MVGCLFVLGALLLLILSPPYAVVATREMQESCRSVSAGQRELMFDRVTSDLASGKPDPKTLTPLEYTRDTYVIPSEYVEEAGAIMGLKIDWHHPKPAIVVEPDGKLLAVGFYWPRSGVEFVRSPERKASLLRFDVFKMAWVDDETVCYYLPG